MSRVTDPHAAPPTDPNNPWHRTVGMEQADGGGRHVFDEAATGLDGPLLDELLKMRMTEGIAIGRARGIQLTHGQFPEVHDNGYANGRRDGWEAGYAKAAEERDQVLRRLQGQLTQLVALARGKVTRARLEEQLDEIAYALGQKLRRSEP